MSNIKKELFRNTTKGKIGGVCAGVADYFGWETWLVRILVVSGVLLGLEFLFVVYIAAWFILDKKTEKVETRADLTNHQGKVPKGNDEQNEPIKVKAKVWQAGEPPQQAFRDIKSKYGGLEVKLRTMEKYVTSPEFTVSREINKL